MRNTDLAEIYQNIVRPEAEKILSHNCGLFLVNDAYEIFLEEYNALHEYYTKKYMNSSSEGFDTHKEISTIIISLLKAKLIKTVDGAYYQAVRVSKCAFNEELAFFVGCGILQSCMACDYRDNEKLGEEERTFSLKEIQKILLLPKTSYQTYQENVITEFYYTSREGSYNVLGLADKFFWIEQFNKRHIKEKYSKMQ